MLAALVSHVGGALLPVSDSDERYDVAWRSQPKLHHMSMPDSEDERLPQMAMGKTSMPEATHDKAHTWDVARAKATTAQLMQQPSSAAAPEPAQEALPCPVGADGTASCIRSFGLPTRAVALPDISVLHGRHPARFVFDKGASGVFEKGAPEPTDFGEVQGAPLMNHALSSRAELDKGQRPASEAPCALGGCPNDGLGMVEKPGLAVPRRALAMAALDGPAHHIAPAVPAVPLMPERPPERRAVPTMPEAALGGAMPEAAAGGAADAADAAGVAVGVSRRAALRRLEDALVAEAASEGVRTRAPEVRAAVQAAVVHAAAGREGGDLAPVLADARRLAKAHLWRLRLDKLEDESFRPLSREEEQRMLARMPDAAGGEGTPASAMAAQARATLSSARAHAAQPPAPQEQEPSAVL